MKRAEGEFLPEKYVVLATPLQGALHALGVYAYPGGQVTDDWGIWWCPCNAQDWRAGGAGNPLPRLDHAGTVLALVALLIDHLPRNGRAPPPAELRSRVGDALNAWARCAPAQQPQHLHELAVLACEGLRLLAGRAP